MMIAFAPAAAGVPVWLAVCALVALSCMIALVGVFAVLILRRADQRDFPEVLLGLSHVISALCGLLPWGKPTPPPALPEQATAVAEPPHPMASVVLVRPEPAAPVVLPRDQR
ncbi:hypothetical protein [Streptomyces anulatus]|uniref:hypothetical protein n=1 Tax=Streptomyces anulatus TaxID=1892 RepID=UPI00386C06C1|nr:hypothetical protein OG238_00200 [Streptomyces anulatus]WST90415.1 hypothetical protein OG238_41330 [Streptomyces anulatus]WSW87801.1 hypothetical protein OG536_38605 [Streptomyces anulatus]